MLVVSRDTLSSIGFLSCQPHVSGLSHSIVIISDKSDFVKHFRREFLETHMTFVNKPADRTGQELCMTTSKYELFEVILGIISQTSSKINSSAICIIDWFIFLL